MNCHLQFAAYSRNISFFLYPILMKYMLNFFTIRVILKTYAYEGQLEIKISDLKTQVVKQRSLHSKL